MKTYRILILAYTVLAFLFTFTLGPQMVSGDSEAGFLLGLANGMSAMITLIVSLFDNGYMIYNINNNGPLYNWGFIMGVSMLPILTSSKKDFQ